MLDSYENLRGCLYQNPHPALKYLQIERSLAILLDRPAHPFFDGASDNKGL
jgi:hypothetical protein